MLFVECSSFSLRGLSPLSWKYYVLLSVKFLRVATPPFSGCGCRASQLQQDNKTKQRIVKFNSNLIFFHSPDLRLPPIPQATRRMDEDGLYHFTNKIDFPLKTFYVNPFPSPIDVYDQMHQPILLTLKSSQKYFVPGQSVVQEDGFSRW